LAAKNFRGRRTRRICRLLLEAATQRLRESAERLPTLRDIYVESLRLHLLIFGPIIATLVAVNLLFR